MGLAISRSIVENHGGKLWATLKDGPEQHFNLRVPVEGLWPVARSARINSSLCAKSKLREWLVLIV
jgi:hypothetical protein